jgi:probable addiction module antidote protein
MNVLQSEKGFDAASLENEESIADYLNTALEHPNPEVLLLAVKNIARARGMTQLAQDTGLGRESLYKSLSEGAKPRYDTIMKVVRALGVKFYAKPVRA